MAHRLSQALIQAKAYSKTQKKHKNESEISAMLSESVKQFDLRQVVFGCLYRVGLDLHELSYAEKQYMEII